MTDSQLIYFQRNKSQLLVGWPVYYTQGAGKPIDETFAWSAKEVVDKDDALNGNPTESDKHIKQKGD